MSKVFRASRWGRSLRRDIVRDADASKASDGSTCQVRLAWRAALTTARATI